MARDELTKDIRVGRDRTRYFDHSRDAELIANYKGKIRHFRGSREVTEEEWCDKKTFLSQEVQHDPTFID